MYTVAKFITIRNFVYWHQNWLCMLIIILKETHSLRQMVWVDNFLWRQFSRLRMLFEVCIMLTLSFFCWERFLLNLLSLFLFVSIVVITFLLRLLSSSFCVWTCRASIWESSACTDLWCVGVGRSVWTWLFENAVWEHTQTQCWLWQCLPRVTMRG